MKVRSEYLGEGVVSQLREAFLGDGILRLEYFVDDVSGFANLEYAHRNVPNKYSYSVGNGDFQIEGLSEFLSLLLEKNIKITLRVLRFGHGDYTLLYDSPIGDCEVVGFLFCCSNWEKEFGGNLVIKHGGESLVCTPRNASLVLLRNSDDLQHFVEYVNVRAKERDLKIFEVACR